MNNLFFVSIYNQNRGLDEEPAYFPYRDDGQKIVDAIKSMVRDYVNK